MESESSAAFTLTGQGLDPDQVTVAAGIAPSVTWRTGDLVHPKATVRYQHNGWSVRSSLGPAADLEEHVTAVLDQLQAGWEALEELSGYQDAEVACTIYSYGGDRPAIHFTEDTIARIARLHAAVDVDLYVLPARTSTAKPRSETST